MFAEQRRLKMLELIQEEGSVRVKDLAHIFSVTEPTIRQDLDKLESQGFISKEHGGAFLKSVPTQVRNFALQHLENMDKKLTIAKKPQASSATMKTLSSTLALQSANLPNSFWIIAT